MTPASEKNNAYRYAFLILLVALTYVNSLHNRFVWDDLTIIVKNPLLEDLRSLPRIFFLEDRTADGPTGYYRPITYLSFLLDRSIWGLNPLGFNITNILLHIAASLLLFRVVLSIFRDATLALVAAALFAVHPLAGEAVNFHAGGRNTLLCATFSLLSLLCYVHRRPVPALVSFAAAIFSKEFALLLPAVFFLYDSRFDPPGRSWRRYLPYALAIAGYLVLRALSVEQANVLHSMQLSGRLWLVPRLVLGYLYHMVLPVNLKVLYDVSPDASLLPTLAALAGAAAVGGGIFLVRKREVLFASSLWTLLFLLPVIGLLPLGSTLMADRHAYIPLMGFSVGAAWLISRLPRKPALLVTAALILVFIPMDLRQNRSWSSMPTLYARMIADSPGTSMGYTNLGMYHYEQGDLARAEKYLEESCSKKGIVIHDALQYLAAIYWERGKHPEALRVLQRLMEENPGNPQPYMMASKIYERMGDAQSARRYHDKVEAMFPGIDRMVLNRASVLCTEGEKLLEQGRLNEAERKFREALMMAPDFVPALIDMGNLLAEKKELEGALGYFSRAAALEPANPSTQYNLATAYSLLGRTAEADAAMRRFSELEKGAKSGK